MMNPLNVRVHVGIPYRTVRTSAQRTVTVNVPKEKECTDVALAETQSADRRERRHDSRDGSE